MAFSYDHERQLLEVQAANGRISAKDAATELEEINEAEIARLEKCADDFAYSDRVLSRAYLEKAAELRGQLETEKGVLADLVKAAPARNLRAVLDRRDRALGSRLDTLEKSILADSRRRPIGMPAGAVTPSAPAGTPSLRRGPDNRPVVPSKPVSQMTNEQKAAHYSRLARAASTPEESQMWQAESQKCAAAARKERS